MPAAAAASGTAAAGTGGGTSGDQSSNAACPAGGEEHCVSAQAPSILQGIWDINSLGAYLEKTKLQQVRGCTVLPTARPDRMPCQTYATCNFPLGPSTVVDPASWWCCAVPCMP
jgi:hypothetical protein